MRHYEVFVVDDPELGGFLVELQKLFIKF